jgi:serine/threonine protein kinase
MLPNLAEEPGFVAMFRAEAKILRQLVHPNIVRLLGFGTVGKSEYIAMEYVAGQNLRALLSRGQRAGGLGVPLACYLASEICAGLAHAHARNIVHLDLSPENLIVGYQGEVKILDFGVALAGGGQPEQGGLLGSLGSGDQRPGKSAYMSPEQLHGRPVDHRSDLFGMGVCLHELLTGQRLFKATRATDREIAAPSLKNPDVSPSLDRVVLRALAEAPGDRYGTAGELGEALQPFAAMEDSMGESLSRYVQNLFRDELADG